MVLLGLGIALIGAAWATGGDHFYFSYLVGYMGVLGICLCALFFTMVQHITRAGWSITVRRLAENIAGTLPFMLLLFIPIVVGFGKIYHHWAHAELDPLKAGYDAVLARQVELPEQHVRSSRASASTSRSGSASR
jgi:hypothetical protein